MKRIVIIGASSGIGNSLASMLVSQGHEVVGTWKTTKPEMSGISWHSLDVTDPTADYAWLADKVDGLVYCPGAIHLKPFHRINPEDFRKDFDLQVGGAIRVIQKSLPALKSSGSGSVVLFSTVAVQNGFSFHAQVSTSKGAIEGLTRALAAELSPTIRVNCIAPSLTDTPLAASLINTPEKRTSNSERHPMKRIGRPDDIAALAAFLLSDQSGWITGQIIHADGGIGTIR